MRHRPRSEQEAARLQPKIGDRVSLFAHSFIWTEHHRSPSQLAPLRQTYDQLSDDAFAELGLQPKQDAFAALEKAVQSGQAPACAKLLQQLRTVPDWVDYEQIRRGQDVFFRYAGPALTGLLHDSLLGGFGARRIVEVLVRTGSFGVESARRRLLQTTQWVLDIMQSPETMHIGAYGWKQTVRVRILHSHVRQRILTVCKDKPDYYDVDELGVPINDLHSLVTLTSFSSTLIDHTFPSMFVYLKKKDRDDYIALWRYLAYLLGTDDRFFADADIARATLESIVLAELWPDISTQDSPTRILLHNSMMAMANTPPSNMSYDYIVAQVRWLHGNAYADALGLPSASLRARFFTGSKVCFFLVMGFLGHVIPGLDRRRIDRIKPILSRVIADKKIGLGGAVTFEMEWLPTIENKVTMCEQQPEMDGGIGPEKHYLTAAAVVLAVCSGLVYGTARLAWFVGEHIYGLLQTRTI
jgi:hypothetical protein